jgi:hypothetical protein
MKPDPRSGSFVRVDMATSTTHSVGIEDADAILNAIEVALTPAVPAKIRERVRVTRSLIVYAWFCYDFFSVAIFWSFSCIEMALWAKYIERKAADKDVDRFKSFRSLLRWAAKEHLLPADISADGICKLRNSMAHPKHFNIVLFPGAAFDCFELLVRVLGNLWPTEELPPGGAS